MMNGRSIWWKNSVHKILRQSDRDIHMWNLKDLEQDKKGAKPGDIYRIFSMRSAGVSKVLE